MKIRNGFVSNSSSSSFVLISLEDIKEVRKKNNREIKKNPDLEELHIIKANDNTDYSRGNICVLRTIEDKLKYLTILYAIAYSNTDNAEEYFIKMDKYVTKILSIAKKYNKFIVIDIPPLQGSVSYEAFDPEIYKYIPLDKPHVSYYIESSTECEYIDDIKELVEDKDTRYLESFIFNPHSFCVLGGDEYDETFQLQEEEMKKVHYPYFRLEDHKEHSPNKWCYTEQYKEYRKSNTPIQISS